MKSSKAEVANYTQMTGPLFPRLRASETEKAGARAPPMALFEQFTVPSHQFVQPSRTPTALSNQQQQCVPIDNRHPYLSYYVPSLVAYSDVSLVAPSHSQPSHCVSSCVTSSGTTSVDGESQRALRSVGVSRMTTKEDGNGLMELRAKVALNDNIPTEDLPRADAKNMQCEPNTMPLESAEMPVLTNLMNSLQEAMSIVEEMSTCPMVERQNCSDQEKAQFTGSKSVIDDVQLKQVGLKSSAGVLDEHIQGLLTSRERSVYAAAVTKPCKGMSEDELLHVDDLAEGGLWASEGGSMERKEQIPSPSGSSLIDNARSTSMSQQLSGPPHISKDVQKSPADGEKGDGDANELSADNLLKAEGESVGESQNNQINSNEASELSQHATGLRGGSNGLSSSVLAPQVIRPKDVIRAVGQQQFWKARKALLW